MSTILDALKKSEQERKLNNIPTLANMPAPEERPKLPSAIWLALLLVLAVILLGVLAYIGFNKSGDGGSQPAAVLVDNQSVETSQQNNEIIVNVVSWSERAEQRFVIIAGKLLREGEFARPGLKVEEIRPDSVILIERGRRIERKP